MSQKNDGKPYLSHCLDWTTFIETGRDCNEVVREQEPNDVVAVLVVDGEARKLVFRELQQDFLGQLDVGLNHEHVVDRTHHLSLVNGDTARSVAPYAFYR